MVDDLTRLLLDAREGDRTAVSGFVRRAQTDVWRLCAALCGPEDADDLTQEVFVRAWKALPAYRGDASARTWLLAIARRTCADAVRQAQRRRRRAAAPGPADGSDPAGAHAVLDLMSGLPPERRTAFVLTQLIGLSYADAAAVCGCEIGTIRSRVARARADLITALADAAEA